MQQLKALLVGAVVLACSSGAQAGITPGWTGNPSLNLIAFNTVTRAWYIRDTGFLMNNFLPNSVTTRIGDGGATGDKTPDTGLLLDKNNTPNFSDASFGDWMVGQNAAEVRWMLSAADARGNRPTDVHRLITSSAEEGLSITNGLMNGYTSSGQAGALDGFTGEFGLSASGRDGALSSFDSNFLFGGHTLAALDQSVALFYFSRTTPLGSISLRAERHRYEGLGGYATVTLEADGDFVYQVAGVPSPVPLPVAAWLLGSGVLALLGVTRRRRAAG